MKIIQKINQIIRSEKVLAKEHGTSIVELLVAMAISVLVFGIITTALVQFLLVTRWGNDQLIITNDIQVATLWLSRDAAEASSFTPGSGTVYGTLNWADSSHQYRYSYDSGTTSMLREHFQDSILQTTTTVARNIAAQGDIVFNISGKILSVAITSSSGAEIETVNLQFALRTR